MDRKPPAPRRPPARQDVDAFLDQVAAAPAPAPAGEAAGRLIFAMDATASREPSWDMACHIQAEMFEAASAVGGLSVRLAFYRGLGEFKAAPWQTSAAELRRLMGRVRCAPGRTQIARVLHFATTEAKAAAGGRKVNALVFVGDSCEEDATAISDRAAALALAGVPAFMFHEGRNPMAGEVYSRIARITGGACCRFDAGAADQLRHLLAAVAVYAAGGRRALADYGARAGGRAAELVRLLPGG